MSDFEQQTWDPRNAVPVPPDAGLSLLSIGDLYEFSTLYAGRDPEDLVGDLAEDLRLVREEIVAREMRELVRGGER